MKAVVAAFNQEKALVGAFSVIVHPVVEPMDRFTVLVSSLQSQLQRMMTTCSTAECCNVQCYWVSPESAPGQSLVPSTWHMSYSWQCEYSALQWSINMVLDNIRIKMFFHCFTSTGYPTLASLVNFVTNYVTPGPGASLWSRLFSFHPRNFIIGTSYPTNLLAISQRILLKPAPRHPHITWQ